MSIDEGSRLALVERLRAVLGVDAADTLMTYLPPVGWRDVASRDDVHVLGSELRREMAGLRTELKTEMAELRTGAADLRGEMHAMEGRLVATIGKEHRTLLVAMGGMMMTMGAFFTGAAAVFS